MRARRQLQAAAAPNGMKGRFASARKHVLVTPAEGVRILTSSARRSATDARMSSAVGKGKNASARKRRNASSKKPSCKRVSSRITNARKGRITRFSGGFATSTASSHPLL